MKKENTNYEVENNVIIYKYAVLFIRAILWIPALILTCFFLRLEVKGKENLKIVTTGRVIFAANHCSDLDPFVFQYALSFPSRFLPLYFVSLTKEHYTFRRFSFRSFFYGGILFKLMGAYPVYKGLNDYEKAFRNHIKILEMNHSLLMFPEGKKQDVQRQDGKIGNAKRGIILLAKKTQSIIIPVKIKGTSAVDCKSIFLRKRKVEVIFGKPINYNSFIIDDMSPHEQQYKEYAQKVHENIEAL
jgi:1-acyl-sn-glycerol-3-phosphate acyltransferase